MDEVSDDMILAQYLSMGGFIDAICHHLASVPSMTSLLFLFDKNMTLLCFGPNQAQIRWKRLNISMNLLIHHHHTDTPVMVKTSQSVPRGQINCDLSGFSS